MVDCWGVVIGVVDVDIFLVVGLEVSVIVGIVVEFEVKWNGYIWWGGGGFWVSNYVDFFVGCGVDFCLVVG